MSLWFLFSLPLAAKPVRLRHGTIATPDKPVPSPMARGIATAPVSGLFLVQFEGLVQPDWRKQLEDRGVELLNYVPDDTFVARLKNVPPDQLRQLPHVRWVVHYQPQFKLHPGLVASRKKTAAAKPESVAVLLPTSATAAEVTQVRGLFKQAREESVAGMGRIMRGELSRDSVNSLAASEFVLWIEPLRPMKLLDEVSSKIVAGDGGLNELTARALGYDGTGVTVSVADTGLDSGDTNSMHPDISGRVRSLLHYGAVADAADEHSHGTHCAGIIAGNGAAGEVDDNGALYGLGVAPGASLVAQRIFDGVGNFTLTDSFERLTRDAKHAGADIGSNSWGDDTQGRYDLSAMEFDALVRDADANMPGDQPYILEFSAGNAGPGEQSIGSPAVAKNVIATGASQNDRPDLLLYADGPETMADFSSRGPCEDGRIKPDLVAPGTWIASLRSVFADDNNAWGEISANYMYMGGTSQAGPHAAGAAAVFVQYWRQGHTNATPSPALVKAALINSATDMDETAVYAPLQGDPDDPTTDMGGTILPNPAPNMDEGWGRISLPDLIGSSRNFDFVDQSVLLSTGQLFERRVLVGSSAEPLKITLAYTDVPGTPAAIPALVNDLDLEVIAPNGRVYRGNQFEAGNSIPDATAFDAINNVEAVHLTEPVPGEYVVRIHARNVPMDARRDTGAVDQDFALVVSGSFAAPGTGIVTFNRRVYTAPAMIGLSLVDYDLAGQGTAFILLRSVTETNGETIVLHANGSSGLFTGAVATVTGPAVVDGRSQVGHGDLIEAIYSDSAPPGQRVFRARADLQPPVISDVAITNRFGRAQISWLTDEPASSRVLYGTNTALGSVQIYPALTTNHVTIPDGQVAGETNFFLLICSDEAGNNAINNNGGKLFHYVVPFAPPILVVDGFHGDALFDPPPPIGNYTGPLAQLGLSNHVWDVASRGSPGTDNLRLYRAVLWRVPEASTAQPTGLTVAEQNVIREYLAGGGSLFMASMELLSRLGTGSSFTRDVLHVGSFTADATVAGAEGVTGDLIGDGLMWENNYADYLALGILEMDLSDTVTPGDGAEGILTDVTTGDYVGLRYPATGWDSAGRVVFLSFPFDAIPDDTAAPDNRATLLQRILRFLAPGLNGEGSVTFDRPAYTIPSQAKVELADSDLAGLGQINITVKSDSQTNGLILTLNESIRRGVFSGSMLLVVTNATGKLRVTPGDTVRADYFDTSLNQTLSALALVETNAPTVTNVTVEPGYVDAVVYWDTDEPADALIEYGQSPLLGRSAYVATPAQSHAVALSQLAVEHTFYFRIVSRDRAGNVTVDDNKGSLYSFTTLAPLHPPWLDDLEHGNTNWTVYTTEESQRGWELGMPGLLSPPAHSPTNCWGSNLSGDYADAIENYLISPAILLTGGNHATLKFWHIYDFSTPSELDILHGGELLLITNNAVAPIVIAAYSDALTDWEEVEVDLTPYTNQVVYLAWHYALFSLESLPRSGWLVDDVSFTIASVTTGTVVVSNNLWQPRFTVSGPLNHTGGGMFLQLPNAPVGQYSVQFDPVSFYQTPPSQTNTLMAGGTLTFLGHYTFADANSNGISDAWEQFYFGNVSSNRTALTDTDGDMVTDRKEFLSGTVPTNPASRLKLVASLPPPGNVLRLNWDSVTDHAYRVLGSSNFLSWSPQSGWVLPATNPTVLDLPITNGGPRVLRLETQP